MFDAKVSISDTPVSGVKPGTKVSGSSMTRVEIPPLLS